MLEALKQALSYDFMIRALVVGVLVSLCASLLGVSLVLKRHAMIGDGLSHVGFGALAVATALNAAPLAVAMPVVAISSIFLLRVSENSRIRGDSAIAIISTSALAIGVLLISSTTGVNIDVFNYMFGSILAIGPGDVKISVVLSAAVLALFVLFYNRIFAITFDETFSRATGAGTGAFNMMLAFLTAVTIVLGMRVMGAMLVTALIIFPPLTSMRLCKRFKTVVLCSAAVSVACFLAGVAASYLYPMPTGACVVTVNLAVFLLFSLAERIRAKGRKAPGRRSGA